LNEPVELEGGRAKSYPVDLPSLPRLKYFNNFFTVTPSDYADTLARKTPALRTLTVSASHQKPTPAWFSGLDRLSQLESLNLSWGAKTDVAELLKLPALRIFACDNGGVPADGAGFSDFPKLRGLAEYQNNTGGFPADFVSEWALQGGMEQVVEYEGYRFPDFRHLKMLEVAKLRRNEKQHDPLDAASLGDLDRLWSLRLDRADQSDIDAIGRLPNAARIEALYLYDGDYTDLSPLASLVNLKKLELAENDGGIEVLDLGILPRLEHVYIGFFPALTSIVNLDSRPELKYFSLSYCAKLESVGESFTTTKLAGVRLNAVNRFTDLAFLEGSQLRQLELFRCNGLIEPLGIDLGLPDYVLIHDCVNLPAKTPGR
jgi:Leucine-rich repeat (LRR) protein